MVSVEEAQSQIQAAKQQLEQQRKQAEQARAKATSQQALRTQSLAQRQQALSKVSQAQQNISKQQEQISQAEKEVQQYQSQQEAAMAEYNKEQEEWKIAQKWASRSSWIGLEKEPKSIQRKVEQLAGGEPKTEAIKTSALSSEAIQNRLRDINLTLAKSGFLGKTEFTPEETTAGLRQNILTQVVPATNLPAISSQALVSKPSPENINPATGRPYGTLTAAPTFGEKYKAATSEAGYIKGTLNFLGSELGKKYEQSAQKSKDYYQHEAISNVVSVAPSIAVYSTPVVGEAALFFGGAESIVKAQTPKEFAYGVAEMSLGGLGAISRARAFDAAKNIKVELPEAGSVINKGDITKNVAKSSVFSDTTNIAKQYKLDTKAQALREDILQKSGIKTIQRYGQETLMPIFRNIGEDVSKVATYVPSKVKQGYVSFMGEKPGLQVSRTTSNYGMLGYEKTIRPAITRGITKTAKYISGKGEYVYDIVSGKIIQKAKAIKNAAQPAKVKTTQTLSGKYNPFGIEVEKDISKYGLLGQPSNKGQLLATIKRGINKPINYISGKGEYVYGIISGKVKQVGNRIAKEVAPQSYESTFSISGKYNPYGISMNRPIGEYGLLGKGESLFSKPLRFIDKKVSNAANYISGKGEYVYDIISGKVKQVGTIIEKRLSPTITTTRTLSGQYNPYGIRMTEPLPKTSNYGMLGYEKTIRPAISRGLNKAEKFLVGKTKYGYDIVSGAVKKEYYRFMGKQRIPSEKVYPTSNYGMLGYEKTIRPAISRGISKIGKAVIKPINILSSKVSGRLSQVGERLEIFKRALFPSTQFASRARPIEQIIAYHGTTADAAKVIEQEGLQPKSWLALDIERAKGYANRKAIQAGLKSEPKVLKVKVSKSELANANKDLAEGFQIAKSISPKNIRYTGETLEYIPNRNQLLILQKPQIITMTPEKVFVERNIKFGEAGIELATPSVGVISSKVSANNQQVINIKNILSSEKSLEDKKMIFKALMLNMPKIKEKIKGEDKLNRLNIEKSLGIGIGSIKESVKRYRQEQKLIQDKLYKEKYKKKIKFWFETGKDIGSNIPLKKPSSSLKEAYSVLIRRKGRVETIAKGLSYSRALEFGVKRTKMGTEQTFALKQEGFTSMPEIGFVVPTKLFATPKKAKTRITPLTFTERRGQTLTTRAEILALKRTKKRKGLEWF